MKPKIFISILIFLVSCSTQVQNSKPTKTGCVSGDCQNGSGSMIFPTGEKYVGDFKEGNFHGKGNLVFPEGERYEGDFIENNFHGKGLLILQDGEKYRGDFRFNKF